MVDLIIIGAGPAGITAGIYAARKKIDSLILSKDVGGQTILSADVENYTGYQFITGPELVEKFDEHLKQFNVPFKRGEEVKRIARTKEGNFFVEAAQGFYEGRSVIVASGRRSRLLGAKGEDFFRNKGISYCATCDGPLFAKKTVAVVGGGNSAFDAVLQMMHIAEKVYLININPSLGGDQIMREKVEAAANVEILNNCVTKEILGDQFVRALKVEQAGTLKEIAVQGIFIEIGSVPNSDFVEGIEKNKAREIIVDNLNRTNIPGLFAAGDVTDIPEKQIIVAAGEGAKAVLGVFRYLSRELK